ncbi:MAG: Gfo/Idh/MocA family oxidoreductase [Clostridia bacterium]|nr:Gfo/Idh/MocA family oxidoreductase [Clostridia bacterium]
MIKIGIAGARGLSTVMGLRAAEDVEIAALCDLDEALLSEQSKKHGIGRTYRVFEDMLESDIDAVIVATPMQCHVPQSIAALEAGKHVLCEVTAGVTMDELFWLCEAVEQSGKIYMFAENCCYLPHCRLVREMVRRGMFGTVYYGEGEYLHNVRSLTTYPNGKTSWRKYWQFGKRGSFYPTHSIGPVMQWFEGDHIASISTFSSGRHYPETGLRQDDTTVTMCQLESGKLIRLRVDCMSNRPHNNTSYQLQGTKGVYQTAQDLYNGKDLVWLDTMDPDSAHARWHDIEEFSDLLPERYRNATPEQKQAGHFGSDFFLVEDFLHSLRTGEKPDIDVYQAAEWTAVGLLSELSVENKGRAMEMPRFRPNMPWDEKAIRL